QGDVVGVAALAGDELGVLLALEAAAHPARGLRLRYLCHSGPPWTAAGCAAAGASWRIWPAASWIALTMFWYPVQRQRLPSRPRRPSSSPMSAPLSISPRPAMIMPGVQKPHWRPWLLRNASWRGWGWPSVLRAPM